MTTIVFDCDGTLIDSAALYILVIEQMLMKMGLPMPSDDLKRKMIGPTKHETFLKLLGIPSTQINEAFEIFEIQMKKNGNDMIQVYPGIRELLIWLKDNKFRLAVASCKDQPELDELMLCLDLKRFFEFCVGYDASLGCVDKSSIINVLLEKMRISSGNAILVGDRNSDYFAAQEKGMRFVAALYGYGDKSEFVFDKCLGVASSVKELKEILINADKC